MTDPKEKAPQIKTRTPGRIGGGMFDRVKLRDEPHPIEEILYGSVPQGTTSSPGTTNLSGSTEQIGTTIIIGTTNLPSTTGSTGQTGTTDSPGNTTRAGTTNKSDNTKRTGDTARADSNRRAGGIATGTAVSPERDFHKVPNSITRIALAAGLFKGKSKAVWDYLWKESRGAIVPARTVRRSRPQLKAGAGFGSMTTVDSAVRHLELVGLISVRKIVGESDGNEYEIFTPEEVAAGAFGLPIPTGSTSESGSTGSTQNPVVPVLLDSGSTGTTLTSTDSVTSGGPKTSFKTEEQKLDDEAFAGMLAQLRQAAAEVTGKRTGPAERDRWSELAELLVTELKIAAGRTDSVSSAPAFLTEHLRRRLWKKDKRQLDSEGELSPDTAAPLTSKVDASRCPDCYGTGMYYPEGFDKGVAKCGHEKLSGPAAGGG